MWLMTASPAARTEGEHSTNAHWRRSTSVSGSLRAAVLVIASSFLSRSPSYDWGVRNSRELLVNNSSFSRYSLSFSSRLKSSAMSVSSFTNSGRSASDRSSRPSTSWFITSTAPPSSASDSVSSKTGLFWSSCSIRSSSFWRGSCKISIDWIIRGVRSCLSSGRIDWVNCIAIGYLYYSASERHGICFKHLKDIYDPWRKRASVKVGRIIGLARRFRQMPKWG